MRHAKSLVSICGFALSACAPFVLAPGAEQVQVTKLPADVASCTAVGNIELPKNSDGRVDRTHALDRMKNQTIGFGGNAALITESRQGTPTAGLAYRCPARP